MKDTTQVCLDYLYKQDWKCIGNCKSEADRLGMSCDVISLPLDVYKLNVNYCKMLQYLCDLFTFSKEYGKKHLVSCQSIESRKICFYQVDS